MASDPIPPIPPSFKQAADLVVEKGSKVLQSCIEIAKKIGTLIAVISAKLWNFLCQAASLFAHWVAIGYSYTKKWSVVGCGYAKQGAIVGWEYTSMIATKTFHALVSAGGIGFFYMKDFLTTYSTQVTFTGIGILGTLILTNLWSHLSTKKTAKAS